MFVIVAFVTSNDTKDSCHSSRSSTPDRSEHSLLHASPLKIVTEKLCEHELPLPDGVEIVHAEPAAGHLSSSNIYPACLSPYLICTACSDGKTRFWRCAQVSLLLYKQAEFKTCDLHVRVEL